MKVLHVIPSISLKHGGPSFALPLMVRALVQEGIETDVATTDDDGPGKHLEIALGKPIKRDGGQYFFFRKQTEFYKISLELRNWLEQNIEAYDLIHIHAVFSHTSNAAARIARRKKLPYIVRPLGVLNRWGMSRRKRIKRLSFRFIERSLLDSATALHFTSEQERTQTETLGVRRRSFVVPIGIQLEPFQKHREGTQFFARWPELRSRQILLFLSRIDPTKNLEILIGALAKVVERAPDAVLVVAGTGDDAFVATMREKVERLGLSKHVVWTGFLSNEAKLDAFAAARVFVLPSHSESFGIAAVEALAARVPLIITRGVGIADEVKQAEAAIVVPANAEDTAEGILQIIRDQKFARELSRKGAQLARERFSMESMGRNLVAMYQDCLRQ